MAEFEVDGMQFVSTKMPAMVQFHVLRALSPIIAQIGPQFITRPDSVAEVVQRLTPALTILAEMPEDKVNYILFKCMSYVKLRVGTQLAPIFNEHAQRMMYDNIGFETMMQILLNVLGENFSGFFQGTGQASTEASSLQNGQPPPLSNFRMEKPIS
jgi:hypothetical protein